MKILLIRNDNIGDLINTTPAIEALRKKYPGAQIDIVVNSLNRCAIDDNPFINHIYCYTKSKHKKGLKTKLSVLLQKRSLLKTIRRQNYDICILFRYDFSPSSVQWVKASKAAMTIGVRNPKGRNAFTHNITPDPTAHEVMTCFSLLKPLEIDYQNEKTRFDIPNEMKAPYQKYADTIGFHCSSRMPENKYPFEQFKSIIEGLQPEKMILTAEPADFAAAEKLATETGCIFVKTKSFQDCAALLSHCQLIITLDGGVAHVGPALGVKTITLLGKNNIERWHPWGAKEYCFENEQRQCALNAPEAIIAKAKQLLS